MILYYLLVFLIPFPEYKKFAGFVGDMTMIKVVGILTILYAIFRHTQVKEHRFLPEGKPKVWLALFFLTFFFLHFSLKVFADWSVHLALFYVIMVLVDSVEVVVKTFWITIAALIINCIQSLKGVYLYGWYSRAAGSFGDSNYFALALIVGICMTFCLWKLYPKWRKYLVAVALLFIFTLLLTASRGGILGLAIMFVLFLKETKNKFTYFILALVIIVPLALNFAPEAVTRIKGEDHSTKSSTENRLMLQRAGINMVKANPLNGVGYGNFKPSASYYNPEMTGTVFIAHNSYLSVAAELGLPVFCLFVCLIFSTYRNVNLMSRLPARDERWNVILTTLKIAFAGYCCSIAFLTAEREKYLWLMIFLIMALSKLPAVSDFMLTEEVQPEILHGDKYV